MKTTEEFMAFTKSSQLNHVLQINGYIFSDTLGATSKKNVTPPAFVVQKFICHTELIPHQYCWPHVLHAAKFTVT